MIGSYWCKCPSNRTGRNCQYNESICLAKPCNADEVCLPYVQTTGVNHICIHKNQKFTTKMTVKKVDGWKNYKKFDVENDLNSALQNWKPIVRTIPDFEIYGIVMRTGILCLSSVISVFCKSDPNIFT